ncbi:MAG TPA: 23S rRNA (uracil(1939)-C(5))-methyltransferase RlmD [Solirubrobacteraceae bacterium]|jgi:23S rRNA (uracil1939-C5)-methyltransferase|nr:23S rRNA (uracil(1939)-C(5))-methyltransferase RlmD [Solirubrobacteraceae bacterium]
MTSPAQQPARTRPRPGDELELTVDALAFGGDGIARADGYVVFVAGAIPGDRVRARVFKAKRAYGHARVVELLEPSPERILPAADHPGAPWQVLPYERQLAVKAEQVEDALRRIGRLDGFTLEPIVPAVQEWRYRNKLEYSFGAGLDGGLVCGFHAPGRWDEIVALDDCLLASERGNAAREQVLAWARAEGLRAHDRRSGEGTLRNLVVREGRRTGEVQVRLVVAPGALPTPSLTAAVAADSLLVTTTDALGETTALGETELLAGSDAIEEELADLRFRISPLAFFQTNTEMAERLYGVAAELADLRGPERLFDLYSGSGTIGLVLSARVAQVYGVELVEESVADAITNARLNGIDNARFYAGDVRLALRELVEQAGRPDVVVVDPPRAGLSKKAVRRVIEAAPRKIVYVSCNPTTLAPNAAQLAEAGYALRRVRPVDMFPQTPHIECVAVLDR